MSNPLDDLLKVFNTSEDETRTVLFSFLSRADTTPAAERSRGKGHILDQAGQIMHYPAAEPHALALESDPNLSFEHWGAYWRKVHGPRFTHAESAQDAKTMAKLLQYDQIHRVAAGPSSLEPMPYLPPLDKDGILFDTVIGHIEPYSRPSWDGVAYLQFADFDDLKAVLSTDRVRQKIIPEDKAIFRDLAPLLARQYVLLANDDRQSAVILVKTHVRRADLDRMEFQRLWLHEHAARVVAAPDARNLLRSYTQLHNIGPVDADAPFFHPATGQIDGVTLMGFASMRDAETFLLSDSYAEILASESEITLPGLGEFWTGVAFSVIEQHASTLGSGP